LSGLNDQSFRSPNHFSLHRVSADRTIGQIHA
jgi:hypothetical protein